MEQLAFHRTLEALWRAIDAANKYIVTTAPFTLAKKPETLPRAGACCTISSKRCSRPRCWCGRSCRDVGPHARLARSSTDATLPSATGGHDDSRWARHAKPEILFHASKNEP
jgi:hypothetical protein